MQAMTVDELIVQARMNRTQTAAPLNLESVRGVLHMTVQHILETTDYEDDPAATAAQVARLLATMLATLEDQRQH